MKWEWVDPPGMIHNNTDQVDQESRRSRIENALQKQRQRQNRAAALCDSISPMKLSPIRNVHDHQQSSNILMDEAFDRNSSETLAHSQGLPPTPNHMSRCFVQPRGFPPGKQHVANIRELSEMLPGDVDAAHRDNDGDSRARSRSVEALVVERDLLWHEVDTMSLQLDTRCSMCDKFLVVIKSKERMIRQYEDEIANLLPLAMRAAESDTVSSKPKAELVQRLEATQRDLAESQTQQIRLQTEVRQLRHKNQATRQSSPKEAQLSQPQTTAGNQAESSLGAAEAKLKGLPKASPKPKEELLRRLEDTQQELSDNQIELLRLKAERIQKEGKEAVLAQQLKSVQEQLADNQTELLRLRADRKDSEQKVTLATPNDQEQARVSVPAEADLRDLRKRLQAQNEALNNAQVGLLNSKKRAKKLETELQGERHATLTAKGLAAEARPNPVPNEDTQQVMEMRTELERLQLRCSEMAKTEVALQNLLKLQRSEHEQREASLEKQLADEMAKRDELSKYMAVEHNSSQ